MFKAAGVWDDVTDVVQTVDVKPNVNISNVSNISPSNVSNISPSNVSNISKQPRDYFK